MSKRPRTPSVPDTTQECITDRINVLHYMCAPFEGGSTLLSFTWTPTALGATVLDHLVDLNGPKHIDLFNVLHRISGNEFEEDDLEALTSIVPDIKNVADIGVLDQVEEFTSPPAIPNVTVVCQGWS